MISDNQLLMQAIRDKYGKNFSFKPRTFGNRILKAARIALYVFNSDEDIRKILKEDCKKEEFFGQVRAELKKRKNKTKSLDNIVSDDISLADSPEDHAKKSDFVIVHDKKLICNIAELLADDYQAVQYKDISDRQPELTKLINTLEKRLGRKHFNDHIYYRSLEALYEKVRTGEINSWCNLSKNRLHFFNWEVNLKGVIRYAAEKYILPYYECSLEDLPRQGGLQKRMMELKIYLWRRYEHTRDLFILAYPEMEKSPHWHPIRWHHSSKQVLSKEKKQEYFRFRKDYLFRYRLGCKTKEDVLTALNDDKKMRAALRAEKMYEKIYMISSKPWHVYRNNPHKLVEDLEGEMYNIDPWEVGIRMRYRALKNPDGTYNKELVGKYLLWADKKYGLPLNNPRDQTAAKQIPHYFPIRQSFSADEIREMLKKAKKKWK